MGTEPGQVGAPRVDWVDYAKGFCIIMVVMMHSTLGVEAAAGQTSWMGDLVAFAKPFRMPDFFLISGLFLARVIDRDWRTYLDRKVVHFAYFYVLWVTIQFAFKAPGLAAEHGALGVARLYAEAFIEPFGTLWFIYLLPIFFVVTKLTRGVPVLVIWTVLAALEIAHVHTGWTVIDEFCARFVYFYTGYILADRIFQIAATVQARPMLAVLGLVALGAVQRLLCRGRARRKAVRLAHARADRRGRGRRGLGADREARCARAAALARRTHDRGLSRVLPRHGGLALRAAQDRAHPGRRNRGAARHRSRASRSRSRCSSPCATRRCKFLFERPAWARLSDKPRYTLQPAE